MKLIRNLSFILSVILILVVFAPCTFALDGSLPQINSVGGSSGNNCLPVLGASGLLGTPKLPASVVLTRFDEPYRTDAVAFAVGTPQDTLAEWFAYYYGGFTGYDAQGNAYDLMTDTWSLENVKTDTAGVYYAYSAPDLGDEYFLADGVALPKQLCAVSVQETGKPDINCCVSARGFLRFPWVLSSAQQEQPEQFTVMLRTNGGEWTQLSEGFYCTAEDIQFSQHIFEDKNTYELQVFYSGGKTGILKFTYDGQLSIVDYSGGDRDGGDVNGNGPSNGTQPAPTNKPASSIVYDNEPLTEKYPTPIPAKQSINISEIKSNPLEPVTQNQVTAQSNSITKAAAKSQNKTSALQHIDNAIQPTVQEAYSPTQTIISGLRLRNLCEDEKNIVFGEGNLTVSIPSQLLLALNLGDMDTLTVKLTQPKDNQVTFAVEAFGSAVTDLPGTVLRLHYTPQLQNSEITVVNEAGIKTENTVFDGEVLSFSANTAGTYIISETSAPKESKAANSGMLPLIPLMGGGVCAAVGGTAYLRRRNHV